MNKILFKQVEGKGKFFLNGDLVNGEIVNPEVLPQFEIANRGGRLIMDGDTFDLPEGMGFNVLESLPSKIELVLPEKPELKEESQTQLWDKVLDYCQEHVINDIRLREYLERHFTIKRKES